MTYLKLIKTYPRQLGYGLLHTMYSGNGQTYLVALFVGYICSHFDISRTYYSTMYAAATLTSAVALPFTGLFIDRWNLRVYSIAVAAALGIASILKGMTDTFWIFFLALIVTRHCGQALMTHISATAIARYFDKTRGKALALANLGFPLSEAILPFLITWAFTVVSWQTVFVVMGLSTLFLFIPLTNLLLPKGTDFTNPRPMTIDQSMRQFTRRDVLKTSYIYLILPIALMAPFLFTGFIFHQEIMAETKGWSLRWVASSFAAFAAMRVIGSFAIGPLVDRLSARRLMPFYMLPFCVGIIALLKSDGPYIVLLVWGSAGLTTGFGSNLKQAIWAEVYGTKHLGSIRSMLSPLAVLSTALAPPLFAWGIDQGLSFAGLVKLSLAAVVAATLLGALTLTPRFAQSASPSG